jgi:4-hydroxy-4-methyl-2-oxoglutarate aldolase
MTPATEIASLSTTLASDALDELGLRDQTLGPRLRALSGGPFFGAALPVTVVPRDEWAAPADGLLDVIDAVRRGDVLVLACTHDLRAACWGELLARAALARGATGLVTSGHVRDLHALRNLPFAVVAAGTAPARPDGRLDAIDIGRPVRIDDVDATRGDLVVSDEDGVVLVPAVHLNDVLERIHRRNGDEERIRTRVSSGESLRAAVSG